MTIKFLAGVTAIAALFATIPGHGTLVTTSAGFASPTVDTFGAYNFCATFAQSGCTPPQTLFGTSIQYTGTAGVRGSSLNNGGFGLGTNGEWNSGRNGYVGNDDGAAFSRFTFSTPLSAIGGLSTTHPVSAAPSRSLRTSQFGNARTAHRPGGGQALVGESMNADTPIAVIENIFVIRLGRNP